MTAIAPHMSAFFDDYLPRQRGASEHTLNSYADSFRLLFEFMSSKIGVPPSQLSLEQIDSPMVTAFLEYLETERNNTATTRNVRLAGIKSFFRFLEHRLPSALTQIQRIFAIPSKKTDSPLVPHLSKEEAQALIDAPDPSTRDGIRDRAMLYMALSGGLRVSELTGLKMQDLSLDPAPSILVHGKGRRERSLPLTKETAAAVRAWLAVRGDLRVPEVFVNAKGQQLSRWGFAYIVNKHVKTARKTCTTLARKRISPHVLRHTCAMIVLRATQDIRKVALWLGHSSTQTTDVYTRADPTDKLEAVNALTPPGLRPGKFRPPDKLIALLKGIALWGSKQPPDAQLEPTQSSGLPITHRST
jgi:site-specific recombinase XerD